jgi:hypothetical protein
MSKNFLLVYEQIPETVDYYLLEDPTEDELRTLRIAHGATLGASENAKKQDVAILRIIGALTKPEHKEGQLDPESEDPKLPLWVSKEWDSKKIADLADLPDTKVSGIFIIGCYM